MATTQTLAAKRKEKRWIVWHLTDTMGWAIVGEVDSFQVAKELVVATATGSVGLDKVKLTRAVDLHTVMYPIA